MTAETCPASRALGQRVVSYDQRGSGRSTAPTDGRYDLAAQVTDLEAVRMSLGIPKIDLLGESWGGAVASAYTATYPTRVSALVLVGAVPLDVSQYLQGQKLFKMRVAALQQKGLIPTPLPGDAPDSCMAGFSAVLPTYLSDPTVHPDMSAGTCTTSITRAAYDAFIRDASVPELARTLRRHSGPTLVVAGDHDVFGPGWMTPNLEMLSGSRVNHYIVKNAGHLVLSEHRESVLARISTFRGKAMSKREPSVQPINHHRI